MNFNTDLTEHQSNLKEDIIILKETTDLFQKAVVQDVHLFFLYIINNKLETYKKLDVKLKNSTLSKNDLLSEILKHKKEDGRKFIVAGLYKYHYLKEDLSDCLNNKLSDCFNSFNSIDNFMFEDSIEIFQDYTSIFVILQNEKCIKTKRRIDSKRNKTIKIL